MTAGPGGSGCIASKQTTTEKGKYDSYPTLMDAVEKFLETSS